MQERLQASMLEFRSGFYAEVQRINSTLRINAFQVNSREGTCLLDCILLLLSI